MRREFTKTRLSEERLGALPVGKGVTDHLAYYGRRAIFSAALLSVCLTSGAQQHEAASALQYDAQTRGPVPIPLLSAICRQSLHSHGSRYPIHRWCSKELALIAMAIFCLLTFTGGAYFAWPRRRNLQLFSQGTNLGRADWQSTRMGASSLPASVICVVRGPSLPLPLTARQWKQSCP